jgi:hypothetical protein
MTQELHIEIFIDQIVDSHTIVRNSRERSYEHFLNFPQ